MRATTTRSTCLRRYLREHGVLDDATESDDARAASQIASSEALEQAEAAAAPSRRDGAFDHVYAGVRMPDLPEPATDGRSEPGRVGARRRSKKRWQADRYGDRPRRGRRRARRRLPRHGRPAEALRREPRDRHAAGRARHRRAWPSARRCTACGRWPRSSSPTTSTRPTTRSSTRRPRSATARTARSRCPVVFRAPFGAGVHGGLYHSQSVEALFFHVPGLKIVVPSTPYDCKGLLKSAIRDDDPVLFFEHKKSYRRLRGEVPGRGLRGPARQGRPQAPGQRPDHHHLRHRRAPGARGRRAAGAARASTSRFSTCARCCRSTPTPSSRPSPGRARC